MQCNVWISVSLGAALAILASEATADQGGMELLTTMQDDDVLEWRDSNPCMARGVNDR